MRGGPCQNSIRSGTSRYHSSAAAAAPACRRIAARLRDAGSRASHRSPCISLCRDAHAPIWLSRARDAKYASASASVTRSTDALGAHLALERRPVEDEGGARIRRQLAGLPAAEVRVEDEAAVVDALEQHDPRARRAAHVHRRERQRGRLGEDLARDALRLLEHGLESGDWIVAEYMQPNMNIGATMIENSSPICCGLITLPISSPSAVNVVAPSPVAKRLPALASDSPGIAPMISARRQDHQGRDHALHGAGDDLLERHQRVGTGASRRSSISLVKPKSATIGSATDCSADSARLTARMPGSSAAA